MTRLSPFFARLRRGHRAGWEAANRAWTRPTGPGLRAYLAALLTFTAAGLVNPSAGVLERLVVALLAAYVYWEHARSARPLLALTTIHHVENNITLDDMMAGGRGDFAPAGGDRAPA